MSDDTERAQNPVERASGRNEDEVEGHRMQDAARLSGPERASGLTDDEPEVEGHRYFSEPGRAGRAQGPERAS